jgi:iron complex outermembrane recepter protein
MKEKGGMTMVRRFTSKCRGARVHDRKNSRCSGAAATSDSRCRVAPWCILGVSALYSVAVAAQDAPAAPQTTGPEEVIVTGSRIVRPDYDAPTPTTSLGFEEIQKAAPTNIADYVNQLPQLSGSTTPRTGLGNTSTGFNGLNNLNLRALGANRTLTLFNGQRVASSALNGAVDINNLPSALIERIDVVTGGASAAYGSDAVSGVVNFVLDKDFTGLKADVSSSITDRSDDQANNIDISFGTDFSDGRGHWLVSGEHNYVEGIDFLERDKREWFEQANMLTFASTARPQRIVAENVNTRTVAQGGVITSTALANTQFGAGGVPMPFAVGSPVDTFFMVGGNQWTEGNAIALDAELERDMLWTRASYDLTDRVEMSLEGSYAVSESGNTAAYQRYPGAGSTALVMRTENPFLNPTIAAQAATLGITQFNYGWSAYDFGRPRNEVERTTHRGVVSFAGTMSDKWRWDAYYQQGGTELDVALLNTTNRANFSRAIDAVRDPATGQTVCRSTLTAPTDGCVPLNIFGIGAASPEAIRYTQGVATQNLELTQNVGAFSVSGDPFSTWAGLASTAMGVEYRKEEIEGTADPISIQNGFFTGNFKPTVGEYDVREAFFETVIPLAQDMPALELFELNGAVRYTDYSLAGDVTTWKLGLSYNPIADLRLRAVKSRDIRAPNVGELFQAGQTQRNDVVDTSQLTRPTVSITRVTSGNTALTPEIADTTSFGIVYGPSRLPQFTVSVDYYSIDITDAIATLGNQEIVDRCVAGESEACSLTVRDSAGNITQLLAIPINVAEQETEGFDIQATWSRDIGDRSTLGLRALVSHIDTLTLINGPVTTEYVNQYSGGGIYNTPESRWFLNIDYALNELSLTATARGFGDGVYDNLWASGVQIDNNEIPGATYYDLAGSYRFQLANDNDLAVYFKVENLLDEDPAVIGAANISGLQTNPAFYDVVGRAYRLGIRMTF